jgi:hypothetical protein
VPAVLQDEETKALSLSILEACDGAGLHCRVRFWIAGLPLDSAEWGVEDLARSGQMQELLQSLGASRMQTGDSDDHHRPLEEESAYSRLHR